MTVKHPPPVMVLGCGRSGTSILGELFEHLPDYRYRSEPPFAEVMDADFSSPLAFKVPHESEGFKSDRGLSFPLAVLREKAPEMRFLWIVRHPLDAISSLRIGIAQDWTHHPRPPDWQAWLEQYAGEKIPARRPGANGRPVIEDAPGSYVKLSF